jgi:hypothetical protein
MPTTIDIQEIASPHRLATQISSFWVDWDNYRTSWLHEQKIKSEYLQATSTKQTEVGDSTPWKNNTTLPKLTQIRDNLHANYLATLFPNANWLSFQGKDSEGETLEKKKAATAYMLHKWEQDKTRDTMSQLVLDWIDYGNCFAMTTYVNEQYEDDKGELIQGYVGPRLVRISPYDIAFNPLADKFENTPKIVRSVKTLGDLKNDIDNKPEMAYLQAAFDEIIEKRKSVSAEIQDQKNALLENAGFGGIEQYYESQYIEILDFYGDIYDEDKGVLLKNQLISIADRSVIIRNKPNPSWLGVSPIKHAGWRRRPDNLYAQGPLDNLVGMQYMIDKLQNTKADILDQVIHPVLKIKGQVEDFEWQPGERIYEGDDGDVQVLRVDNSYLNVSNSEIALLQSQMEELAGAPRQSMGIRTPGEKTKFEVQVLDQATNRIYLHATSHFEEVFVEPLVNDMLELSRRNMDAAESIRMASDNFNTIVFKTISKEDLSTKGTLKPRGARRFAEMANRMQDLIQTLNIASTNPLMRNHISGKVALKTLLEMAGFDNIEELSRENVAVIEGIESQQVAQTAQQVVQEEQAIGAPDPELAEFADESFFPEEEAPLGQ